MVFLLLNKKNKETVLNKKMLRNIAQTYKGDVDAKGIAAVRSTSIVTTKMHLRGNFSFFSQKFPRTNSDASTWNKKTNLNTNNGESNLYIL